MLEPRGSCVPWEGNLLLLTLLLPFLLYFASSSSFPVVGLRTLGTVAKIIIFLVSAMENFSAKGMCPVTMYLNSGSPTRIFLKVSYLTSFLLSLGNQQPSIRENPFSEASHGEGACRQGFLSFSHFLLSVLLPELSRSLKLS